MLGCPPIPLVLFILLCWILWHSDILQLVVALSAICGIVGRSLQQDLGKANAQTQGFGLFDRLPQVKHADSRFRHDASPKPSGTTTLLKKLLCAGRQLKQQATILLSLLSKTLCICTATAEEGSLMHLFFWRMHREPALSGAWCQLGDNLRPEISMQHWHWLKTD